MKKQIVFREGGCGPQVLVLDKSHHGPPPQIEMRWEKKNHNPSTPSQFLHSVLNLPNDKGGLACKGPRANGDNKPQQLNRRSGRELRRRRFGAPIPRGPLAV